MDEMKEAQLRRMLKSQGKTHEEINSIVERFKESERQELEAQAPIQETEPIEETEISEEEQLKARLLDVQESKRQERERLKQESEENLFSRKHEVLDKIETQLLDREKILNALILENSNLRTELTESYAKMIKQFNEDRVKERERYARGLDGFHGKIFEVLGNFANSPTEQTFIMVFHRQGSNVSLHGLISSKKVILKEEIKPEVGELKHE